jgi:hypothetical protein
VKFPFAASCGIPASMNVGGCGGGVPVTHLNREFALEGSAILSGGMPMGVKEAGLTEGVAADKGLGTLRSWSMRSGTVTNTRTPKTAFRPMAVPISEENSLL